MTRSLRPLAKERWSVSDLGQQLQFAAGPYVGYYDPKEDALAGSVVDGRVPRTGGIAVIGFQASEKLGIIWTVEMRRAVGRLENAIAVEVRHVDTEYQVRVAQQPAPATLHLAALHGITVLREAERPVRTRRRGR